MDKMKMFEAISLIDDDIVEDAAIRNEGDPQQSGDDVTVTGVELYKGGKWRRIASVAAAILLVAGLGSAGALMLRHDKKLTGNESEKPATSYSGAPTTEQNGAAAVTTGTDDDTTERTSSDDRTTEDTSADSVTTEAQGTEAENVTAEATVTGTGNDDIQAATAHSTTKAQLERTTSPVTTEPAETAATTMTTTFRPADSTTTTAGTTAISAGKTVESNIRSEKVIVWFGKPGGKPENVQLSGFDSKIFTYEDDCIYMVGNGTRRKLVGGFATIPTNAFFTDLNGDGSSELLVSVNTGSGISIDKVFAYDIRNDKEYELAQIGKFDFMLTCVSGRLYVLRREMDYSYPATWAGANRFELTLDSNGLDYREVNGVNGYIPDVNRDGLTNVYDAVVLAEHIVNEIYDPYIQAVGDIDSDGRLTSRDVALLLADLRECNIRCDINEDGSVNEDDELYFRDYLDHRSEFSGVLNIDKKVQMARCESFGDLNGDGEADEKDILCFSWYD